jgi:N6-adenosine-specific RNA methylase IME4
MVRGDDAPTRKELQLSKRQATRGSKLAEMGRKIRDKLVIALKEAGKAVTPNTVLAMARANNKVEKKHELAVAAFSESGPFDVVVIDPPWPMQKIDRDERPNQDAFDYPVMIEEQIAEFWKHDVAPRLKTDCHTFWWTTQKFLPMTLRLLETLGLRYVLVMVWHKAGGFQPNDLPQYNCEFVVYARKGAPLFIDTKDFFCCFDGKRREHSRKPDEFYDTIRRVTGGSRIDVFSREEREGFAQYGNQIDRFAQTAAE